MLHVGAELIVLAAEQQNLGSQRTAGGKFFYQDRPSRKWETKGTCIWKGYTDKLLISVAS
jgi:hypothetical protein